MSVKEPIAIYFTACDFFWSACSLWYDLDFHPRNPRPYSGALTIDALAQAILDQELAAEDYLEITISNHPTLNHAYEKHAEDLVTRWAETLQADAKDAYESHFVLNYNTSLYVFYKGFLLYTAIEFQSLLQGIALEPGELTDLYEARQPVIERFIKETKLELTQVSRRIDIPQKSFNILVERIENTAVKLAARWRENVYKAASEL